LGGAERELVLMNGTVIAALIFGVGFHWVSLTIATLLATAGHWALTRAAKYDPRLSPIYVRHVRYQSYYPARPSYSLARKVVEAADWVPRQSCSI
jgi:type IV secretion system protein VirB3